MAEIYVIAVTPKAQGQKIGTRLIEALEKDLRENNINTIKVKTLSSKSSDKYYKLTREFYEKTGFRLYSESDQEWGTENPCAIYIKNI